MSGKWITAANRSQAYPRRTRGELGNGIVSDKLTNDVLRELARIAHDSGVVQVGIVRLADSLQVTPRAVRKALKRLRVDGWIVQAVRGTGNRHNRAPRESVYVLRQLPDADGVLWPPAPWLAQQWLPYTSSRRWQRFDRDSRTSIRAAWSGAPEPVDNASAGGLLGERQTPTRGTPVPHTAQAEIQEKTRVHPRAAERQRRTMRVLPDAPVPDERNAHPEPEPEQPDAHAVSAEPEPEQRDASPPDAQETYPDGRPIPASLIPPAGWEPPSRPRNHPTARRQWGGWKR